MLQEVIFLFEKRRIRYEISSPKAENSALGRDYSMPTSYFELSMRGGIHLPVDISAADLCIYNLWRKFLSHN